MYTLVLPVHENECVTTPAQCVKRDGRDGYEMRCYKLNRPFEVNVFDVDYDNGTVNFKKAVPAKRVDKKEAN